MNSIGVYLAAFLCCCLSSASAQYCGFSSGKNFHKLKISTLQNPTAIFPFPPDFKPAASGPARSILLPQWSASELPFFCKIEHEWAKEHSRTPVKFRLGSVDYVDWLEGKSFDKTRF